MHFFVKRMYKFKCKLFSLQAHCALLVEKGL